MLRCFTGVGFNNSYRIWILCRGFPLVFVMFSAFLGPEITTLGECIMEYVHIYHLYWLNLDFFADNFVCEGGDEKKQHPRTGCHWINLVQCNEHCGMEQKRGACSRASHQALEGIRSVPGQNILLLNLEQWTVPVLF